MAEKKASAGRKKSTNTAASAGRKKSTNTAANPGKVSGAGTVTPKNQDDGDSGQTNPAGDSGQTNPAGASSADGGAAIIPREQQTTRADVDIHGAFKAGQLASDRGYPSKPPKGLTEAEIKDWYAGYKSVANPQSQNSLRPEDPNKPDGYRGSY